MVTAETAPLVKYLKADLQRIVNSANEELKNIRCAGLVDSTRQAEEARVINEARAFAVRRVESTVRHLHSMKSKLPIEHRPVNGVDETEKTTRFKLAPPPRDSEQTTVIPTTAEPVPVTPVAPPEPILPPAPEASRAEAAEPIAAAPVAEPVARAEPVVESEPSASKHAFESDDTEVLEELATLLHEIAPLAEPPVEPPPPRAAEPPAAEPEADDTELTRQLPVAETGESQSERMERLLKFVARQEPGLRWAVGIRDDGSTLLVTDLAHGWIPPGITLPDEVQLLEPGRRKGTAAALLGQTALLATYAPGDPLGWATDYEVTDTSSKPRELPAVDDLGWVLGEATHWRDGLPRMVNTLAKAGAAGTGIVDAEIDILRVYLDTSRYQLLAQYPDVEPAQLLNCLLLAATEGMATKNIVDANYHFAWFQLLSSPPPSNWKAGP
ncbi:DUF5631 domain-containing protein [Mycobacterium sp. 1245111.1]|uniref:DUF5631 domain-containing protein n=1 Tax=Mycobacterium sp. 1245111.1 TaxID=1834073 RepID=UPI000A6D7E80